MSPYREQPDPFPQLVDVPVARLRAARAALKNSIETIEAFLDFYQRSFLAPDSMVPRDGRETDFVNLVSSELREAREALEGLPQ